ncbi:MAG TPA: DNA-binding response regulator [Steroidobacteraceae bacterium]|nr:DNA-binding response regulator [Steroidobacteraceae bacterium]
MEALAPARVLVVDDEVRALRLMSRVLASSAIACRTAESAAEALNLLKVMPEIDVVVSDIYMPTTDGIEFLGTVRRDFADRPWLQLLLVTGQASLETAVAAMRLEASDYLFKPIEPKTLREAVQHALTRAESIRTVRATTGDSPGARELQQIADTAKALAEDMRRTIENDSGKRDRPAPGQPSPARPEDTSLRTLKLLQKLQEARSSIFGEAVMPEPAWEMLAELMRARLAGQHLSVTSLALSSKSPMTTALRRIEDLIQGGLAARMPDPADRRRTYVELTPEGMARMQLFLEGFARTALVSS